MILGILIGMILGALLFNWHGWLAIGITEAAIFLFACQLALVIIILRKRPGGGWDGGGGDEDDLPPGPQEPLFAVPMPRNGGAKAPK